MNHPTPTSRKFPELAVGLAAPLIGIAGYAMHVGAGVGDVRTIVAATLTGATIPVLDRFFVKPALAAVGVAEDLVLQYAARATANGALGLLVAVWLIVPKT